MPTFQPQVRLFAKKRHRLQAHVDLNTSDVTIRNKVQHLTHICAPSDLFLNGEFKMIMELPKEVLIQEYRERSKKLISAYEKVSMLQDVLGSKLTEADATLGYLTRKAAENGINTPIMNAVSALTHGLETSYSTA